MMNNSMVLGKIYVDKELVKDLFNFLKEKNLIPKDYILTCFQSEDEEFGLEYYKRNRYFELEQMALPYYLDLEEDDEEILRNVIKKIHNIDIFNHFENLNKGLNDLVFSIMHELAHLHQYLTYTNEDFLNSCIEYKRQLGVINQLEDYMSEEQLQTQYRALNQERYADNFAINVMNKYKNELEELLEKYNYPNEFEMVSLFGEYFEI